MKMRYEYFLKSMEEVKGIEALYSMYSQNELISVSDILRWQLSQSVSCLDKFMHDIITKGLTDIFCGKKNITKASQNVSFTIRELKNLELYKNEITYEIEVSKIISKKYNHKTFQSSKNIKEGLALIWEEKDKFSNIALKMEYETKEITLILDDIVSRRNQIVHQGDCLVSNLEKQDITLEYVNEKIKFIEKFVTAIYELIK